MKSQRRLLTSLTLLVVAILLGCSATSRRSPDVSDSIRESLDRAGLSDIKVSQDRDAGVVTLTGQVPNDGDKSQAESIASSIATGPDFRGSTGC
jgi:osmotically-inducible protein OsmY